MSSAAPSAEAISSELPGTFARMPDSAGGLDPNSVAEALLRDAEAWLGRADKPDYEAMRLDGGGREQAEGELLPVIDELVLKIKELVEEKGK